MMPQMPPFFGVLQKALSLILTFSMSVSLCLYMLRVNVCVCFCVYVCVSVCVADRQGGQWVDVACPRGHYHEFILWHYGRPAPSLTTGNELLRPNDDPLSFERRFETEKKQATILNIDNNNDIKKLRQ